MACLDTATSTESTSITSMMCVFVVKFFSTLLAVASGLPVGPEGPMVYMGATIGKHLSQGHSSWHSKIQCCFRRFRTMQSRRDFISAGAAAGIASAFGAPVGGMLFAMEEVASFWNLTLAWQIFFACMVATFTTDVLVTSFGGFESRPGILGSINEEAGILFGVDSPLSVNILIFLPTLFLAPLVGLLGTLHVHFGQSCAHSQAAYRTVSLAACARAPDYCSTHVHCGCIFAGQLWLQTKGLRDTCCSVESCLPAVSSPPTPCRGRSAQVHMPRRNERNGRQRSW